MFGVDFKTWNFISMFWKLKSSPAYGKNSKHGNLFPCVGIFQNMELYFHVLGRFQNMEIDFHVCDT